MIEGIDDIFIKHLLCASTLWLGTLYNLQCSQQGVELSRYYYLHFTVKNTEAWKDWPTHMTDRFQRLDQQIQSSELNEKNYQYSMLSFLFEYLRLYTNIKKKSRWI